MNPSSTSPRHKPPQEQARDERDEFIGSLYNQGLGRKEIKKLMPDVTGGMLDNIIKKHRVAEEAREQAQLEAAPISVTAQKILDAYKRKLEKDFEHRVLVEVIKRSEAAEARLRARWDERLGALEKAWNRRGKVFTKAEYGTILKVLHPDGRHASDDARNEAFRVFNARKIKLLDEDDFPTHTFRVPLPTREEMAAARAEYDAKNRARAQRAAAARKARQQEAQP